MSQTTSNILRCTFIKYWLLSLAPLHKFRGSIRPHALRFVATDLDSVAMAAFIWNICPVCNIYYHRFTVEEMEDHRRNCDGVKHILTTRWVAKDENNASKKYVFFQQVKAIMSQLELDDGTARQEAVNIVNQGALDAAKRGRQKFFKTKRAMILAQALRNNPGRKSTFVTAVKH